MDEVKGPIRASLSSLVRLMYVLYAHDACSFVPARLWVIWYQKVGVVVWYMREEGVGIMIHRGPTMRTYHRYDLGGNWIFMSCCFCAMAWWIVRLEPYFLACDFEPDDRDDLLFEQLPVVAIQQIAQLSVVVHLAPAVAAPLAASHVDEKIALFLVVVDSGVDAVGFTGIRWEGIDLTLLNEGGVRPDPWLSHV